MNISGQSVFRSRATVDIRHVMRLSTIAIVTIGSIFLPLKSLFPFPRAFANPGARPCVAKAAPNARRTVNGTCHGEFTKAPVVKSTPTPPTPICSPLSIRAKLTANANARNRPRYPRRRARRSWRAARCGACAEAPRIEPKRGIPIGADRDPAAVRIFSVGSKRHIGASRRSRFDAAPSASAVAAALRCANPSGKTRRYILT